jgi:hypothetical protein
MVPEAARRRPPTPLQCLIETHALPADWMLAILERRDSGFIARGAVYPIIQRDGAPDFSKPKAGTERRLALLDTEFDSWLILWECETGLCSACLGSAMEWVAWTRTGGDRFRPCERCNCTGVAPHKRGIAGRAA